MKEDMYINKMPNRSRKRTINRSGKRRRTKKKKVRWHSSVVSPSLSRESTTKTIKSRIAKNANKRWNASMN